MSAPSTQVRTRAATSGWHRPRVAFAIAVAVAGALLVPAPISASAAPAPTAPSFEIPGIDQLDVNGHSLANSYGATTPSEGGTGWASQVASALGVTEENEAINGTHLLVPGLANNGWGSVLTKYSRTDGTAPFDKLPNAAVLWYGANDIANFGTGALPRFKHALRTVVSRHRASKVYEESSAKISYGSGWASAGVLAGTASGTRIAYTSTNGADLTINLEPGDVPEGGSVALGFSVTGAADAVYNVEVDGQAHGVLDGAALDSPANLGLVYRIPTLDAGAHKINITASNITRFAYFDYFSVEPAIPEPGSWRSNTYSAPAATPAGPATRIRLMTRPTPP